jgi:uncharacterized radical SAM superfamily Fe-S cluster-containing enzyme
MEAREGDAWLAGQCPTHGAFAGRYFQDAAFYEALHALRSPMVCCEEFVCAQGQRCSRRATRTLIYMVNVTNNCNMTCATCLAGTRRHAPEPYRSARRLLAALPDARALRFSPHAVFFGGEPTLHPELPELVRQAKALGYVPRLATNGLKLCDASYVAELAEAGLRWLFLHVDSLDDDRNRRLRGRPMEETCREAIRVAQRAGMKVQLGATVGPDNLSELAELLTFARDTGVFWVSVYPAAEIARTGPCPTTYLTEIVDALEKQTAGRVARRDFLMAARWWAALFRLTGRHNFRQKPTMLSLPLVSEGDSWIPLTRLFGLDGLRHPRALLRFARAAPRLLDYERQPPARATLVVNIQQFQSRSAFDLEEAAHSLMSYADDGAFVPFDVYNHCHRWADLPLGA